MQENQSFLYDCQVVHERLAVKAHRFTYRIFMFLLELDEIARSNRARFLFGTGPLKPYRLSAKDHFRGRVKPEGNESVPAFLRRGVEEVLEQRGHRYRPARIQLLTNVRIFGYVFNPVSFYFCYDEKNELRHVVTEVNNTYGEQKFFVNAVGSGGKHAAAVEDRQRKHFYVSPFITHDTDFAFRYWVPSETLRIQIDSESAGSSVLRAGLSGKRRSLSDARLLFYLLRFPLMTVRVILAIHWQAFRLFLKGVPHFPKRATDEKIRIEASTNQERLA
ncbi:MAG: DUF1365 domain-containing protein [Spirochaetales bacterium]|nr:DUF1365 domain-containing protein [Leptospiraceae bacterium]MCP5480315.1 DUF1365 domain-containing protein [Spirochaetales bacterium]